MGKVPKSLVSKSDARLLSFKGVTSENTHSRKYKRRGRMKKSFLVMLTILCFLFLGRPDASAQKVVKIGGLLTTSGAAAHLGKTCLNGALLAVDDINAKGGITVAGEKYKIELVNYDDKCVAKDAVSATERLVRQDKVPVILGAICSHCTLAAMEITEKEKIPILTPISASVKITAMGYKYIFRTWSHAAIQTETMTRFAVQDLKVKTAAFVGRNDAWCRSSADEFKARLEARGGKVLVTEFYEHGTTDYYPQLTKAKNANPDFIYFCSLTEDGGLVMKQAKELGITAKILGTDEMGNEQVMRVAGDAANGAYLYWTEGPKKPKSLEYEDRYKKKYGVDSNPIDKGGYDALSIIANTLERAATVTDNQKIRDAMAKTDFEGIRQRYAFSENGQAKIEMWVVEVENKKPKFVKPIPIYDNPAAPL
jgi:branched-chain amino acid transport system substrate-binding protein